MFQILSWNIRQGGGSRLLAIAQRVIDLTPQVVIFSEFKNNATGQLLRGYLQKGGYIHQVVTLASPTENTVLLASKLPFVKSELYPGIDPDYSNNIATIHFELFAVCGVYLPHKKPHVLFKSLEKLHELGQPFIIAGDFNTGINYIDQVGNSFMYEAEFKNLLDIEYIDTFRYINGQIKEYSWYSHQGNGFRYDHTLISKKLASIVKDCRYLHQWREDNISDHSPMLLTIG